MDRPLIPQWTAAEIEQATDASVSDAIAWADSTEQLPLNAANATNTLERWDHTAAQLEDVQGSLALLNYVHPDESIRDAADRALVRFASVKTNLLHRKNLYQLLQRAQTSTPQTSKLKQDLLENFMDAGVNLPVHDQQRVAEIMMQIVQLGQDFERNLRETNVFSIPAAYATELPASYVSSLQQDTQSNLIVGFSHLDYQMVVRYISDEDLRRRYYVASMSRASPINVEILDQLTRLRKELASIHGYQSYAHYALRHRMVQDPATVRNFIHERLGQLRDGEKRDVDALRALKAQLNKKPLSQTELGWWDVPFYEQKLHEGSPHDRRETLPVTQALEWMLAITAELYGIRYEPVQIPTWHPDVMYFDVYDERGPFLAGIYLDLFPREGKQKSAGVETIRRGSKRWQRTPVAALVANFSRSGRLSDDELKILFHEFGHVMHEILSATTYHAHAGTNVAMDFVEAPSQLFEEWRNHPQTLTIHRDRLGPVDWNASSNANAQKIGSALQDVRQCLYSLLDLELAGDRPSGTMAIWRKLEGSTLLGHVEGTAFPSTFEHIATEYACGYYSYIWSKQLAKKMFFAVGPDIMNPQTGVRLRRLLASGGEIPPDELVNDFLASAAVSPLFDELQGLIRPEIG